MPRYACCALTKLQSVCVQMSLDGSNLLLAAAQMRPWVFSRQVAAHSLECQQGDQVAGKQGRYIRQSVSAVPVLASPELMSSCHAFQITMVSFLLLLLLQLLLLYGRSR